MVVKEIPYFDLSEICDSGQCFRMERITENEFQIRAEDKYLRATQEGETVRFDCSEEEFETFWKHYFDLERDYGIYIEAIDPEDTYLKTAAELGSGIRILNQDLWEMIVSFLISQQNNIFRIRKCIDRISRRYGEEASGEVDLAVIRKMTYPEAREELLKLYGVGVKVADCICLMALHELSAFPVDTHIRQALEKHYPGGFPAKRYGGMEGVLQQYIFYYELIHKE